MISERGSASAYLSTLERLRGFVERATTVVPGHGSPVTAQDAKRILEEDGLAYVEALLEQADAKLPEGRRSPEQRRIHGRNLATLGVKAQSTGTITASVSPVATDAPTATGRSLIVPARWAVISFSIFIASITQIRAPSSTAAPASTETFSTVP